MTVGALFAAGVFAGGAAVVGPLAPAARAADGLVQFDDCEDLLAWYVDRGVADVGPYGWGGQVVYRDLATGNGGGPVPLAAEQAGAAASDKVGFGAALGRSSSETGTNTQEAGVDEPDNAKTDGSLVVRLVDATTLVIVDVSGGRARTLSRVTLPGRDFYAAELLLVGDHVLALATDGSARPGPVFRGGVEDRIAPTPITTGTKVFDVDISDPSTPVLAEVARYSGSLVAARQYGDVVRLVTATGRPELPWYYPGRGVSAEQATRKNQDLVRRTTVEDWLPSVRRGSTTEPLVDCDQVLHPRTWSGAGTVAVTTFRVDADAEASSVAVTADAQVAYSSGTRLYVAAAQQPDSDRFDEDDIGKPLVLRTDVARTDVHAFALDDTTTTYRASGTVAGSVRDRWSLDEYDGVLRVAWTRQSTRGRDRNGVTTLREHDGRLVRLGQLRGLGVGEQIQAVRWFDDLAVLVTFRRIDPLYTIDLADPAEPVARGELKIPGFSGYLHPLGDGRLLGLGVDADADGRTRGAQAATFDIGDPTDPQQLDRVTFGGSTGLPTLGDPRGFTWLPGRGVGLTAVEDYRSGSRLVALRVTEDGDLSSSELTRIRSGWQTRALPIGGDRVVLIDGKDLRILEVD